MALQPCLVPGRCQNLPPVVPVQRPSSPCPGSNLPQVFLYTIHPPEFRSDHSSTSLRFQISYV
ncbi:hypothetical protein C0J52_02162 [Blattella germanica]|nr:hypothetical protein C0J52_02162 [Blattella germanica]